LQEPAKELARSEEMFLADEFIERTWPHARGQWLGFLEVLFVCLAEEVDGWSSEEKLFLS
jgi:hypothetical protein